MALRKRECSEPTEHSQFLFSFKHAAVFHPLYNPFRNVRLVEQGELPVCAGVQVAENLVEHLLLRFFGGLRLEADHKSAGKKLLRDGFANQEDFPDGILGYFGNVGYPKPFFLHYPFPLPFSMIARLL